MKREGLFVIVGAILAIVCGGCGNGSRMKESLLVFEMPDTVYRAWDDIQDEDYLKRPEEKRFKVEYANGVILIYAVNEDEESVDMFGGNPNGVEKLNIPGKVEFEGKEYCVKRIAAYSFATFPSDSIKWMKGVKEITVGEGIEYCDNGCFEGAPDLEHITLPGSLLTIGYMSVADCKKLEKVEFSGEPNLLMIEGYAFMNCTNLQGFRIPASLILIREAPWRNCKLLRYLEVAEGNANYKTEDGVLYTKSGRKLVQYPGGKIDKVYNIEPGTMEIYNSAFYGNEYVEKVALPNSLEIIQHLSFAECTNLKDVAFNEELKWIGNSAFEGCRSLKEVMLPLKTEYTQDNSYGYDTFPEWTKVNYSVAKSSLNTLISLTNKEY